MNKYFQTVFMRESDYVQVDREPEMANIENVVVTGKCKESNGM